MTIFKFSPETGIYTPMITKSVQIGNIRQFSQRGFEFPLKKFHYRKIKCLQQFYIGPKNYQMKNSKISTRIIYILNSHSLEHLKTSISKVPNSEKNSSTVTISNKTDYQSFIHRDISKKMAVNFDNSAKKAPLK